MANDIMDKYVKKGSKKVKPMMNKSGSWLTNVAKSIGGVSFDILEEMMPATVDNAKSAVETTKDLVTQVKEARSQTRNLKAAVDKNFYVGQAKLLLSNSLEDLKSGNFNNKSREDAVRRSQQGDDDFDFDFDDSSFDFDEDESFDSSVESDDGLSHASFKHSKGGNNEVTNITVDTNLGADSVLVQATEYQTETTVNVSRAMIDNSRTNTRALMTVIGGIRSDLGASLGTINENIGTITSTVSESLSKHASLSAKYYEDSIAIQTKILTHLETNLIGGSTAFNTKKFKDPTSVLDLFGASGNLDLNAYKEVVKKQFNSYSDNNFLFSTLKYFDSNRDVIAGMIANPLGTAINSVIKGLIPKVMSNAVKGFDDQLKETMIAGLNQISGLRRSSNPILNAIGSIFGLQQKVAPSSIDRSQYNKGARSWTGIDHQALTNVIPTLLRKIYSNISGTPEIGFDYDKGVYRTVQEMTNQYEKDKRSKETSSFSEYKSGFKEVVDKVIAGSKEDKQKLYDTFETYIANTVRDSNGGRTFRKGGRTGKELDENGQLRDDIKELSGGNDLAVALIRAYMEKLVKEDKAAVTRFYGQQVQEQRTIMDRENREMQEDPIKYNLQYIDNGLTGALGTDANLKYNKDKTTVLRVKNGIAAGTRDNYNKDTNYYLREMLKLMNTGIYVVELTRRQEPDEPNITSSDIPTTSIVDANGNPIIGIETADEEPANNGTSTVNNNTVVASTLTDVDRRHAEVANELKRSSEEYAESKRSEERRSNYSDERREKDVEQGKIDINDSETTEDTINAVVTALGNVERTDNTVQERGFIGKILGSLSEGSGLGSIIRHITDGANKAGQKTSKVFDALNEGLFEIVFGDGQGRKGMGAIFNKTINGIKSTFKKLGGFLDNKIFKPLDEALFGENGLVNKIKESDFGKAISDAFKNAKSSVTRFLFGEKGQDGERTGGIFSQTTNALKTIGTDIKEGLIGKKGPDGKPVPLDQDTSVLGGVKRIFHGVSDSIKDSLGIGKSNKTFGEKFATLLDDVKNRVSDRASEWSDNIFGRKDEEGNYINKVFNSEFANEFKSDMKGQAGHVVASSSIGALASFFLPGGPIGGALIGAGIGVVSKSQGLQRVLFGDKDENGERTGGLITKDFQNFFKDHKDGMTIGAIGGLASSVGLLPSFFLPGGPIGGALIGTGVSLIAKSGAFDRLLYGEGGTKENPTGGLVANFKKAFGKNKSFKGLALDAGIGAGVGLLGSMFLPGGPIVGALLGSAISVGTATDKFKNWFFGEEDEETGKRKGGVFHKFTGFMKENVFDKLATSVKIAQNHILGFVEQNMVIPFKVALNPLIEEAKHVKDQIKEKVTNLFDGIKDQFHKIVIKPVGDAVKKHFIDPLKNALTKVFSGLGKLVGGILSAPFKLFSAAGKGATKNQKGREYDDKIAKFKAENDPTGTFKEKGLLGYVGSLFKYGYGVGKLKSEKKKAVDQAGKDYDNTIKQMQEESKRKVAEKDQQIRNGTDKSKGTTTVNNTNPNASGGNNTVITDKDGNPVIGIETADEEPNNETKVNSTNPETSDNVETEEGKKTEVYRETVVDILQDLRDFITGKSDKNKDDKESSNTSDKSGDDGKSSIIKLIERATGLKLVRPTKDKQDDEPEEETTVNTTNPEDEEDDFVLDKTKHSEKRGKGRKNKTRKKDKGKKRSRRNKKKKENNNTKETTVNNTNPEISDNAGGESTSEEQTTTSSDNSDKDNNETTNVVKKILKGKQYNTSKDVHKIAESVDGQLNGLGYNVFRIYRTLLRKFNYEDEDMSGNTNKKYEKLSTRIKKALLKPFKKLKETILKPFKAIGNTFRKAISNVKKFGKSILNAGVKFGKAIVNAGKTIISGAVAVGAKLLELPVTLFKGAGKLLKKAMPYVGKLFVGIGKLASKGVTLAGKVISASVSALTEGIKFAGKAITDVAKGIWDVGKTLLGAAWEGLKTVGRGLWEGGKFAVKAGWQGIKAVGRVGAGIAAKGGELVGRVLHRNKKGIFAKHVIVDGGTLDRVVTVDLVKYVESVGNVDDSKDNKNKKKKNNKSTNEDKSSTNNDETTSEDNEDSQDNDENKDSVKSKFKNLMQKMKDTFNKKFHKDNIVTDDDGNPILGITTESESGETTVNNTNPEDGEESTSDENNKEKFRDKFKRFTGLAKKKLKSKYKRFRKGKKNNDETTVNSTNDDVADELDENDESTSDENNKEKFRDKFKRFTGSIRDKLKGKDKAEQAEQARKGSRESILARLSAKDELEKKESFKDRMLSLLHRNTVANEAHGLSFFKVFDVKKGLITAGLIAAIPLIIKLIKKFDLGALISSIGDSIVTGFKEIGGFTGLFNNVGEKVNDAVDVVKGEDTHYKVDSDGNLVFDENGNLETETTKSNRFKELFTPTRTRINTETGEWENDKDWTQTSAATAKTLVHKKINFAKKVVDVVDTVRGAKGAASTATAVATAAGDTATTATKTGIVSKAINLMKKALDFLIDKFIALGKKFGVDITSSKLGTVLTKIKGMLTPNKLGKHTSKISDFMMKITGKQSAVAATLALAEIGFAVYGVLDGLSNAGALFEVSPDAVDAKMRAIAGVFKALLSTSTGSWIELINSLAYDILGCNFLKDVASHVYKLLSDDAGDQKLDDAQAEFTEAYEAYVEEEYVAYSESVSAQGQTPMSLEEFKASDLSTTRSEYNSSVNKSLGRRIFDTGKAVVKGVGTVGKTVVSGAKALGKGVVGLGKGIVGGVKAVGKGIGKVGSAVVGGIKKDISLIANDAKTLAKKAGRFLYGSKDTVYYTEQGSYYMKNGDVYDYYSANGSKIGEDIDADFIEQQIDAGTLVQGTIEKNGLLTPVIKGIKSIGKGISKWFKTAVDTTVTAVTNFGKGVVDYVKNTKVGKAFTNFFIGTTTTRYYDSTGNYYMKNGDTYDYYNANGTKIAEGIDAETFEAKLNSGELTIVEDYEPSTVSKIVDKVKGIGKKINDAYNTVADGISNAVSTGINTAINFVSKVGIAIKESPVGKAFTKFFIGTTTTRYYDATGNYYVQNGNTFDYYDAKGQKLAEGIDAETIELKVSTGELTMVEEHEPSTIEEIKTKVTSIGKNLVSFVSNTISTRVESIKEIASKAGSIVNGVLDDIKENGFYGSIRKWFTKKKDVGYFDMKGNYYVQQNDGTYKYFNGNGDEIASDIPESEVMDMLSDGLLTEGKVITGDSPAKSAIKDMQSAIKDAWSSAKKTVSNAWSNFTSWISGKGGSEITENITTGTTTTTGGKGGTTRVYGGKSGSGSGSKEILNGMPYYSQNDPQYKNKPYRDITGEDSDNTIGQRGCGPTAMAMVASKLTGKKYDPTTMARMAEAGGYSTNVGTTPEYFNAAASSLGINSSKQVPSMENLQASLGSGKSVILQGVRRGDYNSPYTAQGHYITVTGMNGNKVMVNDPRGREYSGAYNLNDILSDTVGMWSFGGSGGKSGSDMVIPKAKKPKMKKRIGKKLGGFGKTDDAEEKLQEWLSVVRAVKQAIAAYQPGYSQKNYISIDVCGKRLSVRTDCSGYVGACLKAYGVMDESANITSQSVANAKNATMLATGFTPMSWTSWDDLVAGDILGINGHTEIFAYNQGDNLHYVYNCGSDSSTNSSEPTLTAKNNGYTTVWRLGGTPTTVSGSSSSSNTGTVGSTSSGSTTVSSLSELLSGAADAVSNSIYKSLGFNVDDGTSTTTTNGSSLPSSSTNMSSIAGSDNAETIWNYFKSKGLTNYGIAGLMGNMQQESGLEPTNLQNSYEKSLNMNDQEYTNAVDNGSYNNFVNDSAGYGLVQWTYHSLKQDLLNYKQETGKSIGDLGMQLDFLTNQLQTSYPTVWNTLKTAGDVRTASNSVMLDFERPGDQSEAAQEKRANFGQSYYNLYGKDVQKLNASSTIDKNGNTLSGYGGFGDHSGKEKVSTSSSSLSDYNNNTGDNIKIINNGSSQNSLSGEASQLLNSIISYLSKIVDNTGSTSSGIQSLNNKDFTSSTTNNTINSTNNLSGNSSKASSTNEADRSKYNMAKRVAAGLLV